MDNPSIKEIQEELLILLKKFHSICMENGIKYSLYAGTLIGAVREKGFIPWDDDVDISFTRAEYEKFRKVITEADLGEELRFSDEAFFFCFCGFVTVEDSEVSVGIDHYIEE